MYVYELSFFIRLLSKLTHHVVINQDLDVVYNIDSF